MTEKELTRFVTAIKEKNREKVKKLIEKVLKEEKMNGYGSTKIEELPGIGPKEAHEIQMYGYDSIESLGSAPLEKIIKIPCLSEGKAKKIKKSAQAFLKKRIESIPGVGKDRAEEIWKEGYTSLEDLHTTSAKELAKIPKIGRKSAKKIKNYAAQKLKKEVEELHGVGKDRAKELFKHGYYSTNILANTDPSELEKLPKIGTKTSDKIILAAKEQEKKRLMDITEASVAKEIQEYGYYSIKNIAEASLENLIKIPSLREGRAEEISKFARKFREESGKNIGYRQALKGVLAAIDSDHELTLVQKISDGTYSRKKLKEVKVEMKKRADQEFRPKEERGFSQAWADILENLLETEK